MSDRGPYYDVLKQTIYVARPEPEIWPASIAEFYKNPNNPHFRDVSRIILHETLHHWQSASFPFWVLVVLGKIQEGKENPLTEFGLDYPIDVLHDEKHGFSAWHLYECWARFWDAHMRGSHNIMQDEHHEGGGIRTIGDPPAGASASTYTGKSFDYVVVSGRMGQQYELPYRWIMASTGASIRGPDLRRFSHYFECADPEAEYISLFCNALFPITAFISFQTADPAKVFKELFSTFLRSPKVHEMVHRAMDFSVMYFDPPRARVDIAHVWAALANIGPIKFAQKGSVIELRLDPARHMKIDGMGLALEHRYLNEPTLQDRIDYWFDEGKQIDEAYEKGWPRMDQRLLRSAAKVNGDFLFMYPGIPASREILGELFPPKRIVFSSEPLVEAG